MKILLLSSWGDPIFSEQWHEVCLVRKEVRRLLMIVALLTCSLSFGFGNSSIA